ncbi:hypothetical protein [Arcobacter sp.]|uniref:hypothetical protein n=1 Tax=Arcobacter sp. TaxID=1872629 RepID=UPI003D0C91F5
MARGIVDLYEITEQMNEELNKEQLPDISKNELIDLIKEAEKQTEKEHNNIEKQSQESDDYEDKTLLNDYDSVPYENFINAKNEAELLKTDKDGNILVSEENQTNMNKIAGFISKIYRTLEY